MAHLGKFFLTGASCVALVGLATDLHARDYVAQRGDSLGSIAQQQLGNAARWQELCTLNQLANCNVLLVGQTLRLPTAPDAANTQASAPAPAADPAPVLSENILPNPELSGAVPGQTGQGGALPSGWTLGTSSGSDLQATVVESAPGSVTLSLRQTQSKGWAQIDLSPRGADRLTAASDQMFQANAKIEVLSGTLDGAARLQLGLMHYQPDGERLRPDLYFTTALPLTEAAEGITGSVTTTPAETATVGMFLRVLFDGPFEAVVRVSDVELAQESVAAGQSDN